MIITGKRDNVSSVNGREIDKQTISPPITIKRDVKVIKNSPESMG